MKTTTDKENIRLVGVLQEFGSPFVLLYADTASDRLYLSVRIIHKNNPQNQFLIVDVTPEEVDGYMDESIGLNDIFKFKEYRKAMLNNKHLYVENQHSPKEIPQFTESLNYFDSEFCMDDVWIRTFINRVKTHKPLEIA